MILTADEIADLVRCMRVAGVAEVEIEERGDVLRVVAGQTDVSIDSAIRPAEGAAIVASTASGQLTWGHPARPHPVERGDSVAAGEVIGTIAIGPLLRPVTAPATGRIGRQFCQDGAQVEAGAPLCEVFRDSV